MNLLDQGTGHLNLGQVKKKKDGGASWTLSYGDMVTTLLCFFIIFYAVEKQNEKKQKIEDALVPHTSPEINTKYEYAVSMIEQIPGIEVVKTSSFVDIHFKKVVFFKIGEVALSPEGKTVLEEVMGSLAKIEGNYSMEIQGHADNTKVKFSKSRWWKSNMELSVLRALSVHAYLADKFLKRNSLVVSGYGDLKRITSRPEDTESFNRRISLRLQLLEK